MDDVTPFGNEDRWPNLPAWLFSAAIALTLFSGNWRQLGLPGLVSPDRLLLIAGFVALLFKDPALGQRPYLRLTPTHVVLLVAAAFAICSAVAAGTIGERATIFPLVDRFGLVPFSLFLVGPIAFADEDQRRILLRTFLVIGAYLGLTALFQGLGIRALVFPRYIIDISAEVQTGRARGPFLDAAINGIALFYCAVAAMLTYVTESRPWLKRLAVALATLCLFDLIFTQERSVWLGAVAAILCAAAAAPALRRRLLIAGPIAVLALVAAFVVVPGLYTQTSKRIGDQRTEWDRLNLNKAAENMVQARPLLGFGLGTFKERSEPYFEQNPSFPLTNTTGELHNVFLSTAAELGLIGSSIWLLGLVLAIGGAIVVRGPPELFPWRIGLLAMAIMWLIVANLVPMVQAFPNQVLWLWAGVAWPWRYAWTESTAINAARPLKDVTA
jgi:putative inorganic carbon (HCO3(-)) transporter